MHRYFIKTPWLVKLLFPSYIWDMPVNDKTVYLTFDDGPHPEITPWVLEQLKAHNAKATFFCIGKNVQLYPAVYQQLLGEGHAVGNHTQNHKNGWKVPADEYIRDIREASTHIHTHLFRPPYGRIRSKQAKQLSVALQRENAKVIMWDVLSADFDKEITSEQCLSNVLDNIAPGSIVVFHDSEKASRHLRYTLPLVLAHLEREGYTSKKLEFDPGIL